MPLCEMLWRCSCTIYQVYIVTATLTNQVHEGEPAFTQLFTYLKVTAMNVNLSSNKVGTKAEAAVDILVAASAYHHSQQEAMIFGLRY
mmetsp:Transcript_8051/g.14107  ORF Transcript_8051/g.14107 Transcript_8051/m.14107 type:complete len:88 (+) Transcript_8051:1725-1988(+)